MADYQLITKDLIAALLERAATNPRRRINHNFHSSNEDNPHRFLNVLLRGSYVTPHRHLQPPKAESWVVLEGAVRLFLFDESGAVTHNWMLEAGGPQLGIDVVPGIWHTVAAITDYAAIYEIKPGPWNPATDKEFAPWAPREGEPTAAAYLEELLAS